MNEFGIDEEEDTPELQACKDVSVPECPIKMSDKQEEVLRRIPGSITDDKYGIQQYFSTVDYMKSLHWRQLMCLASKLVSTKVWAAERERSG